MTQGLILGYGVGVQATSTLKNMGNHGKVICDTFATKGVLLPSPLLSGLSTLSGFAN